MPRDVTPNFKPAKKPKRLFGLRPRSEKKTLEDRVLADARRFVRARSGGWCEAYGCTRRAVHAHHIVPRAGGKPDHSPDNLIDLCVEHHTRAHAEPEWARAQNLKRPRSFVTPPRVLP